MDEAVIDKIYANIQITMSTFITGLFIDSIEKKQIKYEKSDIIHNNEYINDFIHNRINNPSNINFKHVPSISVVYGNHSSILNAFEYRRNISINNFLTLLTISRIENHPGLFFLNNSYVTEDIINLILSEIDLTFNMCEKNL